MKKCLVIFILISTNVFAQDLDLSKKSKDELIKIISEKDSLIKSLSIIKKTTPKNDSSKIIESSNRILELESIIKNNNEIFLKELFVSKYINNKNYFLETDLVTEDNTQKFKNSNILIQSIKVDLSDNDIQMVCKQALDFNENYLKLFDIKNGILSQPYSQEKVNEAKNEIEKLPSLDDNGKLNKTKNRIKALLENYQEYTCSLKKELDRAKKNPFQTEKFKQVYTKLESSELYKDYPYLVSVIKKMKSNVVLYTPSDLTPCEPIKAADESKTIEIN